MLQLPISPTSKHRRQQLVTMALSLTANTVFSPKEYERMLLNQFLEGNLTIDQVLERLERREHE